MQYLSFGNSGMEVSRFCIGAMMFGPKLDEQASRQVIDEALEHGVNFIDTAESYGDSEEILGRILDGRRERVYLATKVFRKRARDGKVGRNSRVNVIHSLERSLRLLRTDYVDLYQLHHPDPQTPIEETLEVLDQIVKQGKARYVGVSNHYAWQMAYMIGQANSRCFEPILSIQCCYNILDRAIERETVPFCERFNLAMMVYSPLCGGVLSGKYERGKEAPEHSRGHDQKMIQKRYLSDPQVFDALEALTEMAGGYGVSLPQLAMMWLLGKPFVTTPILGGSRPEHYTLMYDIIDKRLSDEDQARVDELSREWKFKTFINQPQTGGAPLSPLW